ncbi:MAG: class I SAM-dependent methyltransferase [Candidatus Zixiibacteriota bacterium]|nr:MAG: class I SAM-dependent methyltransferase [candidate division Zixibacteria bacterium]
MRSQYPSDYNSFAWVYNQHWGQYSQKFLPAIQDLLMRPLPDDARILDLCCGTGQLTRSLSGLGYRVTGLDGSAEMLRFARQNAPGVDLIHAPAQRFHLPPAFHGALSAFDSLNHILDRQELSAAFANVYAALLPGGRFLFDLNMEEAYNEYWDGTNGIAEDDHAVIMQSTYDSRSRLGFADVTIFRRTSGIWRRSDLLLTQRCYLEADILDALDEAGFREVTTTPASRYTPAPGAEGRTFFLACKPDDAAA